MALDELLTVSLQYSCQISSYIELTFMDCGDL